MTSTRMAYCLAAILILFGAAVCFGEPLNFGEADAGATQKLHVGQEAILTLEMAGGTGYLWQIKIKDEAIIKMINKNVQVGNPLLLGGPVKCLFVFTALKKGATTIEAVFVRPWEADKPAKTITFAVEVQ